MNAKLELAMSSMSEFADRHLRSSTSLQTIFSRAAAGSGSELSGEEPDYLLLKRLRLLKDIETNQADPLALSEFLPGSHADWSEWVAAFQVRPIDEAMHSRLPMLRRNLSTTDWVSLRRYLSLQIKETQGGVYSGVDCPHAPLFMPLTEELER